MTKELCLRESALRIFLLSGKAAIIIQKEVPPWSLVSVYAYPSWHFKKKFLDLPAHTTKVHVILTFVIGSFLEERVVSVLPVKYWPNPESVVVAPLLLILARCAFSN